MATTTSTVTTYVPTPRKTASRRTAGTSTKINDLVKTLVDHAEIEAELSIQVVRASDAMTAACIAVAASGISMTDLETALRKRAVTLSDAVIKRLPMGHVALGYYARTGRVFMIDGEITDEDGNVLGARDVLPLVRTCTQGAVTAQFDTIVNTAGTRAEAYSRIMELAKSVGKKPRRPKAKADPAPKVDPEPAPKADPAPEPEVEVDDLDLLRVLCSRIHARGTDDLSQEQVEALSECADLLVSLL